MSTTNSEKTLWRDAEIPRTSVSVYEALYKRRMAWKFHDRPVPRDVLERMLATSVWAPNHRATEPWRFFVTTQNSAQRERIADFAQEQVVSSGGDAVRAGRLRDWVLKQPVLMFVYSMPGPNEEVTRENYAAVACALHNVGLAGVAEGLAVTWETGGVAKLPGLHAAVGAEADWQLVAMASVGYPDEESQSSRTPVGAFTRWSE